MIKTATATLAHCWGSYTLRFLTDDGSETARASSRSEAERAVAQKSAGKAVPKSAIFRNYSILQGSVNL